jgi:serine/threonine-protein kinase
MGTSYLGYDARRGQLVHNLRVPLPVGLRNDEARSRFSAQAAALAALQHPLLAMPVDVVIEGDLLCIVTPHIDGTALDEHVTAGGLPAPAEAGTLVAELAEALQIAHDRGIVHGDVKPSNILLDTKSRPHLVGFTLPALAALNDGSGLFAGTMEYLAPELLLAAGANPLDPRRDVYALGVVFYELLTGQRPFQGTSLAEVMKKVTTTDPQHPRSLKRRIPRDLEAICLKALARDPSARYASAGALAQALRTFLGGRSSSTKRSWGFWK